LQPAVTSRRVTEITGIGLRQLQWWDERGIVVPARESHKCIYSFDDLAEIAVICELRERGFSLQKIRRVIRFLQSELGKRLVETVRAASEYHLLTEGRRILLARGLGPRGSRLAKERASADVVDLSQRYCATDRRQSARHKETKRFCSSSYTAA
jgi:DNA-binding transcriptional MerR regulator